MRIEPVSSGVGAMVHDLDVGSISPEQVEQLDAAWSNHGVLFLRAQKLGPADQLAFASRFAPVDVNKFFASVEGHPEVAEVLKEAGQRTNIGGGWHADHSYDIEPARGSVLYAVEIPSSGGDTLFADTAAAYDELSDGIKRTLGTLRAVHTNEDVFSTKAIADAEMGDRLGNPEATSTTTHPVVITHPETGRSSLYVNPGFTRSFEGWTRRESKPLLEQLYAHITQPQFTSRFSWEPGSVAMWDNRSVWHYAINDYPGQRRLMHRVTVKGSALQTAE